MRDQHRTPPSAAAWVLIALAAGFITIMIILPVASILMMALRQGWGGLLQALTRRETVQAVLLSLWVMAISLPITAVFGIAAAWAITRFRFPGKKLLLALIDLPISLSPIVVGLMFILLYGRYGIFGGFLQGIGVRVIFAPPGLVLTTLFILLPLVVRELIPTMQEQGSSEEEAALTLGARGWRMFWHVTLPNIRWALLYGLILASARAAGEFGAASVVSGLIRGSTVTLPLQIDIYYNEYMSTMAFASSTIFFGFAGITLAAKQIVGRRLRRELEHKEAADAA
ncbi:sulfate ABC transporter permease [Spirochaeta africana]|uniref:Sulfate ABC transporter, permease protein n=1 Tax=Spirochaeta africana (strain ATCC 700263 / DSM 8902 / Z-7692) TaxID=889378 RepID=H9ULT0_SPIAZ|nr:sulfate ABC transporter permease subunit [Spirochaeta africana]AFG38473.1 sulfate ABC transporter, permease protein [Spirochaeta africana DSM 8902]